MLKFSIRPARRGWYMLGCLGKLFDGVAGILTLGIVVTNANVLIVRYETKAWFIKEKKKAVDKKNLH